MNPIVKIEDFCEVIDITELMKVRGGASGTDVQKCEKNTNGVTCASSTTGLFICNGGSAINIPVCPNGGAIVSCSGGSAISCTGGGALSTGSGH